MANPTSQVDENVVENGIEEAGTAVAEIADAAEAAADAAEDAVDAAEDAVDAAEDITEKGASEHKLEKTIAGIPNAISNLVHKDGAKDDSEEDGVEEAGAVEAEVADAAEDAADAAEDITEKGASEHKLEKTIAGIPNAISGLVHKDDAEGDSEEGESKDDAEDVSTEDDPSKHRIERAVAGVPDALTSLKEKKLAEKGELQAAESDVEEGELRAAEGDVEEGESEHKLEKTLLGIPDQIDDLKDDIAEHVRPVIEQTSADAKARSKEIASGAVMTLVAVVIAAFGIPVILLGIAATLALVVPWWASLLIVGLVLIIIAAICSYVATGHFSKAGEYDVSLKAGIRKSFDYFFKGIGMPEDMAEELRESGK